MIRLIVEVDYFVSPFPNWDWLDDLAPGLQNAGLQAEFRIAPAPLKGQAENLSERRLHAHLRRQLDDGGRREADRHGWWYLHLLVARSNWRGDLGQMFDFQGLDARHREGCAIFIDAIAQTLAITNQPASLLRRLVSRTAFHELGHVFNLGHTTGSDTSAMTPVAQLHRRNPTNWPDDLDPRFNDRQVRFIQTNPHLARPATRLPFTRADPNERHPTGSDDGLKVRLTIPADGSGQGVPIGYPLSILIELQNVGTEPREVPADVSLESGTLAITLQSEFDSTPHRLRSARQACQGIPRKRLLQPGESCRFRQPLFFDRQGWALSSVGGYEASVAVRIDLKASAWIAAQPIFFRVRPWKCAAPGVVDRILDPRFGLYLYLGAASHLTEMHRRAHSLLRECAEDAIKASLSGCLAANALRRGRCESLTQNYRHQVLRSARKYFESQLEHEIDPLRQGRAALRLMKVQQLMGEPPAEAETYSRFNAEISILVSCEAVNDSLIESG